MSLTQPIGLDCPRCDGGVTPELWSPTVGTYVVSCLGCGYRGAITDDPHLAVVCWETAPHVRSGSIKRVMSDSLSVVAEDPEAVAPGRARKRAPVASGSDLAELPDDDPRASAFFPTTRPSGAFRSPLTK